MAGDHVSDGNLAFNIDDIEIPEEIHLFSDPSEYDDIPDCTICYEQVQYRRMNWRYRELGLSAIDSDN